MALQFYHNKEVLQSIKKAMCYKELNEKLEANVTKLAGNTDRLYIFLCHSFLAPWPLLSSAFMSASSTSFFSFFPSFFPSIRPFVKLHCLYPSPSSLVLSADLPNIILTVSILTVCIF